MRIGLIGPSYASQSPNADAQSCVNWYVESVESGAGNAPLILLPTPGLKAFANLNVLLGAGKSHTGNFTQGQAGATFQVAITNNGAVPTQGVVTVTETVPSGLTFVSMSGTGWTVVGNVATRADILNPGASYPPLTVTVNVNSDASTPQVNGVTVSGGGMSIPVNVTDSVVVTSGAPQQPFPIPNAIGLICYNGHLPCQVSFTVPAGGLLAGDTIVANIWVGNNHHVITNFTDSLANTLTTLFNQNCGPSANFFVGAGGAIKLGADLPAGTVYTVTCNGVDASTTGEFTIQAWRNLGAPQLAEVVFAASVSPFSDVAPSITTTASRVLLALTGVTITAETPNWPVVTTKISTFWPGPQLYWNNGSTAIAPPATYTPALTAGSFDDIYGAAIVPFLTE